MTCVYSSRAALFSLLILIPFAARAQHDTGPIKPGDATYTSANKQPVRLSLPHSGNPFNAYRSTSVAPVSLGNSSRLDSLIHDGTLELSLQDAIALALENNLDLAIFRYNIPIAATDVERTRAGGTTRGVNAGIIQGTPGGGVGGFGSGATGAGAGGTTGGAGGAGTGASGLVTSTLGSGTAVSSYDPIITGDLGLTHTTSPLFNQQIYGVPTLRSNEWNGDIGYAQAFSTGTSLNFVFNGNRVTTNSVFNNLNPQLASAFTLTLQQQLLAGFGFGPNLRYLRIAKNNQKISDETFELQLISTVTQIENIYWDLASAYEDEQVKQAALDYAQSTLDSARKQLALQAIPALDVTKDEGEVAKAQQFLAIAKSTLQFQELLFKNAVTRNLDNEVLEQMPVRPLDVSTLTSADTGVAPTPESAEEAIAGALNRRLDLRISNITLLNRTISREAVRNALLPNLALVGQYGGAGLAGQPNPASNVSSDVPLGFGGAFTSAFNNSSPTYFVGLNLNVPLRNRIAKSDQYRSELETRQAELLLQEQRKQIRIEVRNAQYALEQSQARVTAAVKARDLAQTIFTITGKEQTLGAGSALQTLAARRDLADADSALVAARTAYQKAKVELARALGTTLEENHISVESARSGSVQTANTSAP
ncbi:MAG: TolC family protein [Rhodospirillales bacterium]|nr:TolC family protein [Acetobacter sp.]